MSAEPAVSGLPDTPFGGPAGPPGSQTEDAEVNRASWDRGSDAYQERHGSQLNTKGLAWGQWATPESELGILGDVSGREVLELGCGAAQWSVFLAVAGARPVGLDNSGRQLEHARRLIAERSVRVPLVHASAERLPFADGSFDVVFCDHGAMSFADPYRTVPEAARVLRPGGLFAFNANTLLYLLCVDPETDRVGDRLSFDYFGARRFVWTGDEDGAEVNYQLPYGEWIRLFRRCGLVVEDLVELRQPEDAESTYDLGASPGWGRRWPVQNIWKLRREGPS